jgi:hypothetical protein
MSVSIKISGNAPFAYLSSSHIQRQKDHVFFVPAICWNCGSATGDITIKLCLDLGTA